MSETPEMDLAEVLRLNAWLKQELERQRAVNGELRRAVAELARTFQETLARANDAAETGDIERVRHITYENRQAWQDYLRQIIQAAQSKQE
ncbi:MAG TPA: DUF2203 domain-containing protein [Roseiflexaceae bacterium]|nr:DUF2203 domain-containing protein [Roseiflexaceae bacterium]